MEIKSQCSIKIDNIDISSSMKYFINEDKEEYIKTSTSFESPISLEFQKEKTGLGVSFDTNFDPAFTYTLKRKLGAKKTLSLSSVISAGGVSWVFGFHQHDHSFTMPVVLSHSLSWSSALYVAAMPLVWVIIQFPYLFSSGHYNYNEAQRNRIFRKISKAKTQQKMMMDIYEQSRKGELVIKKAKYGRKSDAENPWDEHSGWYNWFDVTIPIQNAVFKDVNGPRIHLFNLYLAGIVDTAPKEDKSLHIEYTFREKKHLAVFNDGDTIILPLIEHSVDD